MGKLKKKIKVRNEKDWEEEVYTKGTLKWYRLGKDDAGVERCEVGAGSGECEVAIQAEDWFSLVVGG